MDQETLLRRRKIAKERIAQQFGEVIRDTGLVVVDCGQKLGYAAVISDGAGFNVHWLAQNQIRTLEGRLLDG